jgi:hypothetical protein
MKSPSIYINDILNRGAQEALLQQKLVDFQLHKKDPMFKRGIYVFGPPGSGKTQFVLDILRKEKYDVIRYDAGDIRNTKAMSEISKNRISDINVHSIYSTPRKIVIVMDEIDGMNNGDKGGINLLINLIRQKKTKKQKLENMSRIPIICIGDCRVDKKITELMKICTTIELRSPNLQETSSVASILYPGRDAVIYENLARYAQGDLRKISHIESFDVVCTPSVEPRQTGAKHTALELFHNYHPIEEHNMWINETDRTSVGLLWHENVIDLFSPLENKTSVPLYLEQLDRICFADFIDRITFQRQIWQFNEFSSLMKTFYNHASIHKSAVEFPKLDEVRFTKALSKYSTEYNNFNFIKRLSNSLGMGKKELLELFNRLHETNTIQQIITMMEPHLISKLDVHRIYRYIDRLSQQTITADPNDIEIEDPVLDEMKDLLDH